MAVPVLPVPRSDPGRCDGSRSVARPIRASASPVDLAGEILRRCRSRRRDAGHPRSRRQPRHPPDRDRLVARDRRRLGLPRRLADHGLCRRRGARGRGAGRGTHDPADAGRTIRRCPGRPAARRPRARRRQSRPGRSGRSHCDRARAGRIALDRLRPGGDPGGVGRAGPADPERPHAGAGQEPVRAHRRERDEQPRRRRRCVRRSARRWRRRRRRESRRGLCRRDPHVPGRGRGPRRAPVRRRVRRARQRPGGS